MKHSELYNKVLDYVKKKHDGQIRLSGELAVSHPIGVAQLLEDAGYPEEYQIVGLLHDIIEDTDGTIEEIFELVQDQEIVDAVISLTKTDDMSLSESIENAKKNEIGRVVKGADRYKNALTTYTDKNSQEFISGFIVKTLVYYVPALEWGYNDFLVPLLNRLKQLYDEMIPEAVFWVNEKLTEHNIDVNNAFSSAKADVIYFELNNWFPGEHYPAEEPFETWLGNDLNLYFDKEEWVKENQLCVAREIIDMSVNYCITATRQWVMENCPRLLTHYREFLRYQEDDEDEVYGIFNCEFLEYNDENIGISYVNNWDD